MKIGVVVLTILVLMLVDISCSKPSKLQYKIADLGTLGGTKSYAEAINDAGQVIGTSETADGQEHSFLWDSNSGMINLSVLIDPNSEVKVSAINNNGQIVGGIKYNGSNNFQAFLWDFNGGLIDLGTFGGIDSWASSINDSEQVAGEFTNSNGKKYAFIWDKTVGMANIGTLGMMIEVKAINNIGQVVGSSGLRLDRAFFWNKTGGMIDLGTLGEGVSDAQAINNAGQVVGYSHKPGSLRRACFWDTENNQIVDLGVPWGFAMECMAFSINDQGQVVGWYGRKHQQLFGPGRAFIWDKNNGMTKLDDFLPAGSGWKYLIGADGINNHGQIVGFGETATGETHAFLMTPAPEPAGK